MIKSLLIAAAAAVLSLSGGGVALASSSTDLAPARIGDSCVLTPGVPPAPDVLGHRNWNNVCVALSVDVNAGRPDHHGNHNPGHYNGPIYRDCNDARSHGYRDIRRGDARYNLNWDRNHDGVACDDGDVVIVSNDGDCVTYATARDSIRNYGLAYNRYRTQYNGDWNRLSRDERDNLNRLYQLDRRYAGQWSTLSNKRTICKDNTPPVTIINEAPPAAVTVTQAAPSNPAPYGSSGGQVSRVPSGGAETGDGSTLIN